METRQPYNPPAREHTEVIRPAAVLPNEAAVKVLAHLRWDDVTNRGVWNANASVWQRFDRPWDGPGGTRGESSHIGSIAVMYDHPARHEVTIYRVTITAYGVEQGWDVARLCDDALSSAGLTLAECPVATMAGAPATDPFKRSYDRS